jgi:hypothetical protein
MKGEISMSQYTAKHPVVWAKQFSDDTVGDEIVGWAEGQVTWTRMPHVMALVKVAGEAGRIHHGDWVFKTDKHEVGVLCARDFQEVFEPSS